MLSSYTGNSDFTSIGFGKTHPGMYQQLTSDHPIDLVRSQVANCYMVRMAMINSGGASGQNDRQLVVCSTVIINAPGVWV